MPYVQDPAITQSMKAMDAHVTETSGSMGTLCSIAGSFSSLLSDGKEPSLKSRIEGAVASITEAMSKAITTIRGYMTEFGAWATNLIDKAGEGAAWLITKAEELVKEYLTKMQNAFSEAAKQIGNALSDMGNSIANAFSGLSLSGCKTLKGGIKTLPADLRSDSINTALASSDKSPQELLSGHLKSSPGLSSANGLIGDTDSHTSALSAKPPDISSFDVGGLA